MAAIFDSAPPLPPAMMAPAWPMRRPVGAVPPAINPTIGFLPPCLASSARNWRGVFFGGAADLPDHDDRLGFPVGQEHLEDGDESVPLTGSPPMPTALVWPRPSCVVWNTAS